jgi:hypothetical protein
MDGSDGRLTLRAMTTGEAGPTTARSWFGLQLWFGGPRAISVLLGVMGAAHRSLPGRSSRRGIRLLVPLAAASVALVVFGVVVVAAQGAPAAVPAGHGLRAAAHGAMPCPLGRASAQTGGAGWHVDAADGKLRRRLALSCARGLRRASAWRRLDQRSGSRRPSLCRVPPSSNHHWCIPCDPGVCWRRNHARASKHSKESRRVLQSSRINIR